MCWWRRKRNETMFEISEAAVMAVVVVVAVVVLAEAVVGRVFVS